MRDIRPPWRPTVIATLYPDGGAASELPVRGPSQMAKNPSLDALRALRPASGAHGDMRASAVLVAGGRHGTLVGAGKRTVPLRPHETQLAAYHLGAKLNAGGFDVSAAARKNEDGSATAEYADPREARRLALSTETLHATRLSLKYGRSNVAGESDPSARGNVPRVLTSYDMCAASGHSSGAGAALHLQAGDCDQHAWINTRMHAATLSPDESVHTLTSVGMHTWTELHAATPPGQPDAPNIVLDSWANGPAVRLQDSAWAHADVHGDQPWESYDRATGAQARADMLAARQGFREGTWAEAHTYLKINQKHATLPARIHAENSVVGPAFAARARLALAPGGQKDPLGREIMAVGAARDAYNLSVKRAIDPAAVAAVVADAANLAALGRPPVEVPPKE